VYSIYYSCVGETTALAFTSPYTLLVAATAFAVTMLMVVFSRMTVEVIEIDISRNSQL
jgi:hypothetical protein